MSNEEVMIFSNHFGSLTTDRLIINYKEGVKEFSTNKITAVTLKHVREYFFAGVGLLAILGALFILFFNFDELNGIAMVIVIVALLLGILVMIANWNGHYLIIITHNKEDTPPIKVEMSKITEGRAFFKAVARLLEKK